MVEWLGGIRPTSQCGSNLVGAKAIFIGLVLIGLPFIPNAQRVSVFIG